MLLLVNSIWFGMWAVGSFCINGHETKGL